MNSSNPFGMFMNMMGGGKQNPFSMLMNNSTNVSKNIPLNQQQFKQFLPQINNNALQQLVQQAKNQGISDIDIQNGLNFINSLK